MKITVYLCDDCEEPIDGPVSSLANGGDYHSSCIAKMRAQADAAKAEQESCQHEENIDGTTHSTNGQRLICKDCGYDRVIAVEEAKA